MTTRASRDAQGAGAEESPQPEAFPIDFEEWASPMRGGVWRNLLAGFEHVLQREGQLRDRLTPEAWQGRFDTWRNTPTA